jgi:integrase
MQREGYRPSTIESQVSALKAIARHTDICNPDDVKRYLARLEVTESRKEALVIRLNRFYKWKEIHWTPPRYRRVEKLPFIPLETEVDQLIAGIVNTKICCFLQLLKETGIRPGEAWQMQWTDVNGNVVNVTPEKNSNPRQFKISNKLTAMLAMMPRRCEYVFRPARQSELRHFRRVYIQQRRNLATKLQNPRIARIAFKTLRHFKATMEYHKTKDILHVMQLLGHKNIRNTLVYTHLVNFESDDYVCKVAKTVEEAKALVESGFDYVTDLEGCKLFRKRK